MKRSPITRTSLDAIFFTPLGEGKGKKHGQGLPKYRSPHCKLSTTSRLDMVNAIAVEAANVCCMLGETSRVKSASSPPWRSPRRRRFEPLLTCRPPIPDPGRQRLDGRVVSAHGPSTAPGSDLEEVSTLPHVDPPTDQPWPVIFHFWPATSPTSISPLRLKRRLPHDSEFHWIPKVLCTRL